MKSHETSLISRDGTTIAYELSGSGHPLILVSAALADRRSTAKLARCLCHHFQVVNYDRRGRGKSSDTLPYALEREVEDIEALIDDVGGSAGLFGSSSGAVLALEAASRLGNKVHGLFMYEPPFIVDHSHPPVPDDLSRQIEALVATNRRHDAVKLFFTRGMGIPSPFVTLMRFLMPGWSRMAGVAHTIPYDLAALAGTQTGTNLPAQRWHSLTAPLQVMVGGKSEAFFHTGAKALADALPKAQYRSLERGSHATVEMAPKAVAAAIVGFFSSLPLPRNVQLPNA
jgi:pimeloyl-ACP methyl ester carboxylesterase